GRVSDQGDTNSPCATAKPERSFPSFARSRQQGSKNEVLTTNCKWCSFRKSLARWEEVSIAAGPLAGVAKNLTPGFCRSMRTATHFCKSRSLLRSPRAISIPWKIGNHSGGSPVSNGTGLWAEAGWMRMNKTMQETETRALLIWRLKLIV